MNGCICKVHHQLYTCNDLILKHGTALQRSLSELEQLENFTDTAGKFKAVNERATLFRITSNAMINACNEYLQLAQTQGRKWQKMLQHEHEQRLRLEDMVEQLAKQHSHLERAAKEAAATSGVNSPEDDEEYEMMPAQPDKNELQTVLKVLSTKLEDLNTCNDLILKHGTALQRSLSELEQLENFTDTAGKFKAVNERATLFRITSNAMINACNEYLQLAQTQGRKWQKMLQHEHEQRLRLEDMVEQLAKQHSHLERAAKEAAATSGVNSPEDDEEYEMMPAQPDKNELQTVLKVLSTKLEDLNTCNDLILKHGTALQRSLSELEQLENDRISKS
ncbi:oxysterol-binding protein 2-like [Centruroides sculpturatus]|uniref:oxysterol-binding protein 2-like n=1 Tax=Centruroides sculpturatus TaxID=218467 RepID=UPI000C6E5DE1|nr:oxysterol-binding protein 2-like [Centruroides sculpturatus]